MKEMGNFEGPGGCKGPEECRAYCESRPDECRGFSGPDHPVGQERAFEMRGFEIPPGLMEECKQNPEACREKFQQQGFPGEPGMGGPDAEKIKNMSEEERQKFMQEDRRRMDFRGPPQGEGRPYQPEGMMPPEAFRRPPEGQGMPPMPPDGQQHPEFQQQYQQEYQRQSQQFMPPPGEFHPPEGEGFVPPPDGGGMMQPPPDGGTFEQPPPPPPSDAPQAAGARFVASVLYIVASLFNLQ